MSRQKKQVTFDQALEAINNLPLGDRVDFAKALKAAIQKEVDELKSRAEAAINKTEDLWN
jgi:alkyl sulfatase BDS1-like metallo-beta-lactamase superfamily hydrolase